MAVEAEFRDEHALRDYVFVDEFGDPFHPARLTRDLHSLQRRAGLPRNFPARFAAYGSDHRSAGRGASQGGERTPRSRFHSDHPGSLQPCPGVDAGGRGRCHRALPVDRVAPIWRRQCPGPRRVRASRSGGFGAELLHCIVGYVGDSLYHHVADLAFVDRGGALPWSVCRAGGRLRKALRRSAAISTSRGTVRAKFTAHSQLRTGWSHRSLLPPPTRQYSCRRRCTCGQNSSSNCLPEGTRRSPLATCRPQ